VKKTQERSEKLDMSRCRSPQGGATGSHTPATLSALPSILHPVYYLRAGWCREGAHVVAVVGTGGQELVGRDDPVGVEGGRLQVQRQDAPHVYQLGFDTIERREISRPGGYETTGSRERGEKRGVVCDRMQVDGSKEMEATAGRKGVLVAKIKAWGGQGFLVRPRHRNKSRDSSERLLPLPVFHPPSLIIRPRTSAPCCWCRRCWRQA